MAVGALEPVFFQRLLTALGLPADLGAVQYEPGAQPSLRAQLGEVLLTRPRAAWLDELADADCCVTPVHDVADAFNDTAALARGLVQQRSDGSPSRLAPVPRFPGVDPAEVAARPAPVLGEHTDMVLAELGHDVEAVARLRAEGVV